MLATCLLIYSFFLCFFFTGSLMCIFHHYAPVVISARFDYRGSNFIFWQTKNSFYFDIPKKWVENSFFVRLNGTIHSCTNQIGSPDNLAYNSRLFINHTLNEPKCFRKLFIFTFENELTPKRHTFHLNTQKLMILLRWCARDPSLFICRLFLWIIVGILNKIYLQFAQGSKINHLKQ